MGQVNPKISGELLNVQGSQTIFSWICQSHGLLFVLVKFLLKCIVFSKGAMSFLSHLSVLYVAFLYLLLPLRSKDGPCYFGSSTLCFVTFIHLICLWLFPFNSYREFHCRKKTMYLVILPWSTFKVFIILNYKQCWNILLHAFFCTCAGLLGQWYSKCPPRPANWHFLGTCQECKFLGPTLR